MQLFMKMYSCTYLCLDTDTYEHLWCRKANLKPKLLSWSEPKLLKGVILKQSSLTCKTVFLASITPNKL